MLQKTCNDSARSIMSNEETVVKEVRYQPSISLLSARCFSHFKFPNQSLNAIHHE